MIFRISDTMLSVRRGMLRVTFKNVPAKASQAAIAALHVSVWA